MKQRDPWFDNAKMALIILVVIGHSWTLLPKNTVDDWLYDFLYSWHIPAFVIVTGYLSKSFEYTRSRMWNLVTTVAVPYVIFEGVYALFRHEVGGVTFERLWANPHWPMWYLSAMFFWRLMTPIFKRMPAKVVVAVVISLLAGLYANDILDNARIFGLLPFFVLGLKMHDGHWNMLRSRRARWYGFAVLFVLLVLAWFSSQGWIESEWFYYRTRYDSLDPNNLRAIMIRMALLIVGLCGSFAFFAVVPRTKTWFSALGAATLVVYLFHGFFVLGAEFAGYSRLGRGPLAVLAGADDGVGRGAGDLPGLEAGVEPAEHVRRPDRDVHREAGVVGVRSGPQLGVTALNGTTSSSLAR